MIKRKSKSECALFALIDKHEQQQQQKAAKAEQALLDEIATQRFFKSRK